MNRIGLIEVVFVCVLVVVFFFIAFVYQNWHFAYDGPITQIKNCCFGGSRVIIGAVEMYDMDHRSSPMKVLDLPMLVKEGYLKRKMRGADHDCRFKADLVASVPVVWCEKHGNSEHPTALYKEIYARETSFINRLLFRIRIAFRGFW